ncbi:MAG: hypothetical protein IH934_04130 [Nanoarchaeota archaeon]|nr:hypothetical protein [Nanoarchaeota archaeon]
MVDINSTIQLLGPVSYPVKEILRFVEFLVGGIFGIYVISLIVRLVFLNKIFKSMDDIKNAMKRMESKIDKLRKK